MAAGDKDMTVWMLDMITDTCRERQNVNPSYSRLKNSRKDSMKALQSPLITRGANRLIQAALHTSSTQIQAIDLEKSFKFP